MNNKQTTPKAFSEEPYASLVKGGDLSLVELPIIVGISKENIDFLIKDGLFPAANRTKSFSGLYNRKKIVAFRWAIENHPRWISVLNSASISEENNIKR